MSGPAFFRCSSIRTVSNDSSHNHTTCSRVLHCRFIKRLTASEDTFRGPNFAATFRYRQSSCLKVNLQSTSEPVTFRIIAALADRGPIAEWMSNVL